MKNLLVMDIGGSKTRLLTQDVSGNVLSETVTKGVASATDCDAPLPVLEDALIKLKDKEDIACIAVNLGGKNTEQVELSIRKFFKDIPLKIFRESEGTAAYALAKNYGASVVLMAGTGAIAVGHSEKGYVTTGGWGINIGDDGSGYDIGLQAIKKSLSALDDTAPLSPMTQHICDLKSSLPIASEPYIFRDNRDEVRARLAPFERQHIAAFSKVVSEFAEKGDKTALDIFEYAGEKLSELVLKTANKLQLDSATVVVTGGLINAKKFWSDSFQKSLQNFKILYINDGLLYGTYLIAKDLFKKGDEKTL